jgi:glycosyltransferase involved in cell wall biosynthesis
MITLGIDASNIRAGGGVTHLVELLRAANPPGHGFSKVIVWSGQSLLYQIEDRSWLEKSHQSLLNKSLPWRVYWQRFRLAKLAKDLKCDVLFSPGGSYYGVFRPFVSMSQNLLPFERTEFMRFGASPTTMKMALLRWSQSNSFKNADGLIFLTQYAKNTVLQTIKSTSAKTTIIPHGVDERFRHLPRVQNATNYYSEDKPFHILYVSIVTVYKHQWHVAEALASLRNLGLPVVLDLVGPAYLPALKRLKETINDLDPSGQFIRYVGSFPYKELHTLYTRADMVLFASSCENMPNILLEGMASGLPIACSNRGPMPEMLQDAGVYFDPEKPDEIASAIQKMMNSPELRSRLSKKSFEQAQTFSWEKCATKTFAFLAETARNHHSRAK